MGTINNIKNKNGKKKAMCDIANTSKFEGVVGLEPTSNGFADHRVKPISPYAHKKRDSGTS